MATASSDPRLVTRIHLVDDSFKTILVNANITAKELAPIMADKLDLKKHQTFALFYGKKGEERCLEDDEQPLRMLVRDATDGQETDMSKFADRNEWEKIKKDFEKTHRVVYKRRVFLKHKPIEKDDPAFVRNSYIQAVADVISGTYPCNQTAAIELAGLQMQATFGDFNKKAHITGFLRDKIGQYIPAPLLQTNRKIDDWEKDILNEYSKISGQINTEEAMMHYLNIVRNWSFYGSTFWTVQVVNKESLNLPDHVVLAVNSNGIQLLKLGTKETILSQRYADIYSWAYKRNAFAFVSGVLSKQKFQFATTHGKEIARTLQAYVEVLLEERRKKEAGETDA